MSNQKPVNSQPNPPKRSTQSSTQPSSQPLAKTTGPQGNLVGGDAKAVPPKAATPKTTPKAKPTASATPQSTPSHRPATAATGAQTTLEQAKQAVEQFAAVNASQAHALGVQLADAEAAFPLTMMQGYQARKAELEGSGMDASTFLAGLTEQVTALQETPITLTLPTADGTALLPGTDPAT